MICRRFATRTATAAAAAPPAATAAVAELITVNGRTYDLSMMPHRAVAVVCVDGCAMEYLEAAAPVMPRTRDIFFGNGTVGTGLGVMPSLTNPNNTAIICGAPPKVTGISGNFYLDGDKEVMMTDTSYLRCDTILAEASNHVDVVVCTAKHKLLPILSSNLANGVALSIERGADAATDAMMQAKVGVPSLSHLMAARPPDIYDPLISVYCVDAGARLIRHMLSQRNGRGRVLAYLSTTDYVQHKHPPGSHAATQFYAAFDAALGALHDTGAVIVLTADHGMNDKHLDGKPHVLYAEAELAAAGIPATVILPITDPYVVHHGALGGYATVYLKDRDQAPAAAHALLKHSAIIEAVLTREQAAAQLELPADRIGDLVILATRSGVIGRNPQNHDVSAVSRLRSHGSTHEQQVPLLVNRRLMPPFQSSLQAGHFRNFDAFHIALNGIQ